MRHHLLVLRGISRPYNLPPSLRSMTTTTATSPPLPTFPKSPIPTNPLGRGNYIRTAAALIIGDEILNGKTLEKNSNFFARYCFENGIELKRIEVISDNENEIIEASRRMVNNYDFVITSGGIGPTHDDITYASLAKSFNQNLVHHSETLTRLEALTRHRKWTRQQTPQQLEATRRMALFPEKAEVIFTDGAMWVPVVRLEGKLCVFPGIPSLFQKMLTGLTPYLPLPPPNERPTRIQVFTERPESMIAPYLTSLQTRLKPRRIQIGSYPVLDKGVFVSIIGRDSSSSSSSSSPSLSLSNSSCSTYNPNQGQGSSMASSTKAPSPASQSPSTTPTISGDDPSIDTDPYAIDTNRGLASRSTPPPLSPLTLMEIAREVELETAGQIVNEEEVVRCREEGGSFLLKKEAARVHAAKC